MTEITPKTFPKEKPHPLVASLPKYLKDPANYEKIQKELLNAGASRHSHAEVVAWAACVECQGRQKDRADMMRELGFKSAAQYMAWQKIHTEIRNLMPLDKYNKKA